MQEDQVPCLTTNTDQDKSSKDSKDLSENNNKELGVNDSQIEKDLQISLAALSSLAIRENSATEPKTLQEIAIIPVDGEFSGEEIEGYSDIWAPTSFDGSNNTSTFYPGSTGTSELGQALREGDIPAALQFLDKEFQTKDEEGYLTDNSLLEEGESTDSFLLDPEQYATVFEDNRLLEEDQADAIAQVKGHIKVSPEESTTELESALHALSLKPASEFSIKERTVGRAQKTKALAQAYNPEQTQGTSRVAPTLDSSDLASAFYCLPCEDESGAQKPPPEYNISTEKQGSYNQINPANFDFGKEELSEQDFEAFLDFSQQQIMSTKPIPPSSVADIVSSPENVSQQQHTQWTIEPQIANSTSKAQLISGPIIRSFQEKGKNERLCLGHKETVFGLSFSPCGNFLATASQDSTICVWDVARNSQISTLNGHGNDHECLRVAWASSIWGMGLRDHTQSEKDDSDDKISAMILASADAGGLVKIWQSTDECHNWDCISTLDHAPKENHIKSRVEKDENGTKKEKDENGTKEEKDENGTKEEKDENGTKEEKDENGAKEQSTGDEDNIPQIYTLEFIDHWQGLPTPRSFLGQENDATERSSLSILMTSSDDYIHFWQACPCPLQPNSKKEGEASNITEQQLKMDRILNFRFTHLEHGCGGVFVTLEQDENEDNQLFPTSGSSDAKVHSKAFGGAKNPENIVYVFDASHCPANNLLGVALSDGTVRLVNGRGVCVSILQLPGCQSHLTSFGWSKTGTRLASCVATGHLILWDIYLGDGKGKIRPACRAVLEGGHDQGRPLYGASFCGGEDEELVLSWGVDGKLCLWDSRSEGQVNAPISVLTSNKDYPLYAADIIERKTNCPSENPIRHIALGGGRDAGFMGVLVYLRDLDIK